MRLFDAIVAANHRAAAGDAGAGLRPDEFADALPVVALTCVDPRLNPLLPAALGIEPEHFIWLRNAGNSITGPVSSTMRSLALACAVKGGKEIAVIGHSDCKVRHTGTMELLERFRALGVDRARLPENLNEFFGLFASERQNVIRGAEFVRQSPLIGPKIPVHGLLVDIQTGRLEWIINGYQAFATSEGAPSVKTDPLEKMLYALPPLPAFQIGEMKCLEMKIGETASIAEAVVEKVREVKAEIKPAAQAKAPSQPPLIPLPPSLKLAEELLRKQRRR